LQAIENRAHLGFLESIKIKNNLKIKIMRIIKIILGIVLLIGSFGSLISLGENASSYESPELVGHVIAIVIMVGLAIFLFKGSGDNSNNEIQKY
jgi:hypothetical protein